MITLRSRIRGAVVGAAIGDAMGHPTEFLGSLEAIRQKYGPAGVTGFGLYWERDGARFAPYTDDFQMSEVVLRTLQAAKERQLDLDGTMRLMAAGFTEWASNPQGGHRAPGRACLAGCRALERGVPWAEAGGAEAGGCGSVMRVFPFGIFFLEDRERAERWAAEHSKLTHRDPIALAACAAMAIGMVDALHGVDPQALVKAMVVAAGRYSRKTAEMIQQAADDAEAGVQPAVTLQRLQGWAAHEAIAAAVYVCLRHPDSPMSGILEGANTPGDSDSIATLVGALLGARCGIENIPESWVREVERSEVILALADEVSGSLESKG